ncbi:hypothetical protein [Parasediminibacterium sp. JCM 36343]|uniref:hypothetical protein n=1 Tax=Parasediminibacterium sp. JCM 36343 TaxID=3374279 RepID=UPI00397E74EA
MYKTVTILYLVLFGLYVLFTRQPDYFDGELSPATIHFMKESTTQLQQPYAFFSVGIKKYTVSASYPLRPIKEGEEARVIYEPSDPTKAILYSAWGYWLLWDELLVSIGAYIVLFMVAVNITKNPEKEE